MQDKGGENWFALVLLAFRGSTAASSLANGKSSSAGQLGSRLNLQGHTLKEKHFRAEHLTSQAQKHSDAVSHPADRNQFNGTILFQYTIF